VFAARRVPAPHLRSESVKPTSRRPFGMARLSLLAIALASGATLAVSSLAACSEKGSSGGSTNASGKAPNVLLDEAADAMGREDWKGASATLDGVISHPKATAEDKASAWSDKVVCEARAKDDAAGIAVLDKMTAAKVDLTSNQYAHLIQDLTAGDRLTAAVAAIAAGTERFKGDPEVKAKFEKLAEILDQRMQEKGDDAGRARLKAIGYVSGK